MERHLIIVGGNVASGKTTIAKGLAWKMDAVFLDKDVIGEPLVRALMQSITGNAHDRDSAAYHAQVRGLTYKALMKTCKSILKSSPRATVVACAPFTDELHRLKWVTRLQRWCIKHEVRLSAVWVDCPEEDRKVRIVGRAAPRDESKIATWDTWVRTLTPAPSFEGLIHFENDSSRTPDQAVDSLMTVLTSD